MANAERHIGVVSWLLCFLPIKGNVASGSSVEVGVEVERGEPSEGFVCRAAPSANKDARAQGSQRLTCTDADLPLQPKKKAALLYDQSK